MSSLQPAYFNSYKRPAKEAEYIINEQERKKYFIERIKAIRQRVETFARCTGENILVIAVDETGQAHHWATGAFQKFVQDERVADIMYQYLGQPEIEDEESTDQTPPLPIPTDPVQIEHLRALLRSKTLEHVKRSNLGARVNWDLITHRPPQWPGEHKVPFQEPSSLHPAQLIRVLKGFFMTMTHQAKAVGLRDAMDKGGKLVPVGGPPLQVQGPMQRVEGPPPMDPTSVQALLHPSKGGPQAGPGLRAGVVPGNMDISNVPSQEQEGPAGPMPQLKKARIDGGIKDDDEMSSEGEKTVVDEQDAMMSDEEDIGAPGRGEDIGEAF